MAPARLEKIDDNRNNFSSISDRIEAWLYRHASLCLLICIILIGVMFVILCSLLVGVSATESGTVYNQFQNII
jgi:hypothetical protein